MNLNATILGQMISFILFIWFCMKYIWPKIILIIEDRQKMIVQEFSNIEKQKENLKIMYNESKKIINQSKKEAINIIKQANQEKVIILEKAILSAMKKKKQVLLQAQSEIKIQEIQLKKKLTNEISTLVSIMTKKILVQFINQKNQKYDIENMIKNL
ncbi:F0F1 ATP synthase subunit B [Buchnera aphidicola]|uniref:ATP synthase subunit b n=1 Tax=Buchnera aphidicola (Therioaphis trifolii) TaxID=1241884 RepID=A0A4D6YAV8_9GAMM|nr:F0F1 ATP synthase subunit B [Buchnera aphidicola]QCI27017.1 ATP synthase F0 subunit B [Buchnera aphidicola (Therioaphis trifolii)]